MQHLLLLLLLNVLRATDSPVHGYVKKHAIYYRDHGWISPNEAADELAHLPDSLGMMDFSRCEPETLQHLIEHLPAEVAEQLKKYIAKEKDGQRKGPLRRQSADGALGSATSSVGCPPRMTTGSPLQLDQSWYSDVSFGPGASSKAYNPHARITPMMIGMPAQWNYQKAFFHCHSGADEAFDEEGSEELNGDIESDTESSTEWQLSELADEKEYDQLVPRMAKVTTKAQHQGSSSSEDDSHMRSFFQPQPGSKSAVWHPPPKPRRTAITKARQERLDDSIRPDESIEEPIIPNRSNEELLSNGYMLVGKDRYVSPTRQAPAERRRISRESSNGRLSRETLLKQTRAVRSSERYRGINNPDNLCYLISVIQALYHLPGVRSALENGDDMAVSAKKRQAVKALRNVFERLGRLADLPNTEQLLQAVDLSGDEILLLAGGTHDGQGDASEAFQRLLSLTGRLLKVRAFNYHITLIF